jgi:peroxiredoxin Q/BCP
MSDPRDASSEVRVGDAAPPFSSTAVGGRYGDGTRLTLQDLAGKTVVLYFYPKDDTPGCTQQACALRDTWEQFAGKAEIFGVSPDSFTSHRKFVDKHHLPFPLLADPEKQLAQAYGVWVEKSMYGESSWATSAPPLLSDQMVGFARFYVR